MTDPTHDAFLLCLPCSFSDRNWEDVVPADDPTTPGECTDCGAWVDGTDTAPGGPHRQDGP